MQSVAWVISKLELLLWFETKQLMYRSRWYPVWISLNVFPGLRHLISSSQIWEIKFSICQWWHFLPRGCQCCVWTGNFSMSESNCLHRYNVEKDSTLPNFDEKTRYLIPGVNSINPWNSSTYLLNVLQLRIMTIFMTKDRSQWYYKMQYACLLMAAISHMRNWCVFGFNSLVNIKSLLGTPVIDVVYRY